MRPAGASSLLWLPSLVLLNLVALATAGLPPPPPRVMLWLLDCEPATLAALAQHTDAVSAVALSLYWVGLDNATGAATLIDVPGGKSCAEAVHTALPELEVWAWVNGGHVGPSWPIKSAAQKVAMMNALFARPGPFVARATAKAKQTNLTGFNLDWEAAGERPDQNSTFYMDTLRPLLGHARQGAGARGHPDFVRRDVYGPSGERRRARCRTGCVRLQEHSGRSDRPGDARCHRRLDLDKHGDVLWVLGPWYGDPRQRGGVVSR